MFLPESSGCLFGCRFDGFACPEPQEDVLMLVEVGEVILHGLDGSGYVTFLLDNENEVRNIVHTKNCSLVKYLVSGGYWRHIGCTSYGGGEYRKPDTEEIRHFFSLPLGHEMVCFVWSREARIWGEP